MNKQINSKKTHTNIKIDKIPLSSAQQRFFLMSNYFENSDVYNMSLGITINKHLNKDKLRKALITLSQSNSTLSIVFNNHDGKVTQSLTKIDDDNLPFDFIELRNKKYSNSDNIRPILRKFIKKPFDINGGILWRFLLIKINSNKFYIYLVMHHLISDAWSFASFFRKLSSIYMDKNFIPIKDNYFLKTFIPNELKYLKDVQAISTDQLFWKTYLNEDFSELKLPFDQSQTIKNKDFSNLICNKLSNEELVKLKFFAGDNSSTLYIVLLASYFILLSRITGDRSFTIGTMVSGRDTIVHDNALGCFANIIPVKTIINGNMTITEYIENLRNDIIDIHEHQFLPFQNIIETYRSNHKSNKISLFNTLFVMQNSLGNLENLFGDIDSSIDEREQERSVAEFPLFFLIRESKEGLFINVQYDTNLFSTRAVKGILKSYFEIIKGFLENEKIYLKDYLCATANEKDRIINEFNNTEISYPQDASCYELFKNQVKVNPDSIAIYYETKTISYKQLFTRAENIASYLYDVGVRPNQYIAICLERSPDLIASLLACFKLHCAYVPLDPNLPQSRLLRILNEPGIEAIICQSSTNSKLPLHEINIPTIRLEEELPIHNIPTIEFDIRSPSYRLFTSGSTGEPKTVTIFQSNLLNLLYWAKDTLNPESLKGVLAGSSINFDASVLEIFVPLCWGGKIILAESSLHYHELPAKNQIKMFTGTPSAIAKLIQHAPLSSSVIDIFLSGEGLSKDLVESLFSFKHVKTIINGYGLTELTAYSSVDFISRENDGQITLGKPISNTRIYILNELLEHAPIGVIGNIFICGAGVPYLDEVINISLKNSYFPEIGNEDLLQYMFKTGDIGYYLPNGRIIYLGRADSQIKLRGYRIELLEIERVLKQNPHIVQAAVVLINHERLEKVLVAYFTSVENQEISSTELSIYLGELLPNYMVPTFFVKLDNMPLNNSGKIDRKTLSQIPFLPENKKSTRTTEDNFTYENEIIEVWQNILGIDNIDRFDSFFLLGGHSLLIPEVSLRLAQRLDKKIPLVEFFMHPTVTELANYLKSKDHNKNILPSESFINDTAEDKTNRKNINVLPEIDDNDVAIISLSFRLPNKINNSEALWHNLSKHESLINEIPSMRWHWQDYYNPDSTHPGTTVCKWGAFIEDIEYFDPGFFNLSKREARIMDPQQRLLLETSWEALEAAGYSPSYLANKNQSVGVFIGASLMDYAQLLNQEGFSKDPYYAAGNSLCLLANRISYILGLNGPSLTLDTACSASLTALHYALKSIRSKEINLALVGSAALMLIPDNFIVWSQMGILADKANSSAFDANASGFVPGEAIVSILIKPAKQAIQDNDNIWGIIKGSAINHDGRTKVGLSATSPKAQADLILSACQDAKLNVDQLDYIETHGTGTRLGDPIEVAGLKTAFTIADSKKGTVCPIGSVKPILGHTGPVAGLASLIKVLLAFKYQQLPPTKVEDFNPEINFNDSPFYVNTELTDWMTSHSKKVGISAFGFGGSNAHIIVQDYKQPSQEIETEIKRRLFILSAQTKNALHNLVNQYIELLKNDNLALNLGDICFTLSVGREHFEERLAIITDNREQLKNLLLIFINHPVTDTEKFIFYGNKKIKEQYTAVDIVSNKEKIGQDSNLYHSALSYIKGEFIDWEKFYNNENRRRIILPTTYYEKIKCWYLEQKNNSLSFSNNIKISLSNEIRENFKNEPNWLHIQQWQEDELLLNHKVYDLRDTWVIFMDSYGIIYPLVQELLKNNAKVILIYIGETFSVDNNVIQINPDFEEDYNKLFLYFSQEQLKNIHIIHAWSLSRFSPSHFELNKGLFSIFFIAQKMQKNPSLNLSLKILTNNTQKVIEHDKIFPVHATIWGFVKSLMSECKKNVIQIIDYSVSNYGQIHESFISLLALLSSKSHYEIAIRKGKYYVPKYVSYQNNTLVPTRIKQGGTYLITGGLGGLGIELALWLSNKYGDINIICLSRNDPNQQILHKLSVLGSKLTILKADVTKIDQMKQVLHEIEQRFGILNGIFHLAGSLDYKLAKDKTLKEIKNTISAKVEGTIILSELTKNLPVDFIILFSSLSAIISTPGLSDYAAANAFLNSFAYAKKNIQSICWGGWSNVGLGTKNHLDQVVDSNYLISKEYGFNLMDILMQDNISQVIVSNPNQFRHQDISIVQNQNHAEDKMKKEYSNIQITQAINWLKNILAEVTELSQYIINDTTPFLELGIDSFLAAKIVIRINKERKLNLKPTTLFQYHTVKDLAQFIIQEQSSNFDHIIIESKADFFSVKPVNNSPDNFLESNLQIEKGYNDKDIAIIGLSCAFPNASNYEEFWNNLIKKLDTVYEVSYKDLMHNNSSSKDTNKSRYHGSFFNYSLDFVPEFFNISPAEAEGMSSQLKFLLQLAYEALESSGYTSKDLAKTPTGVFVGAVPVFSSDLLYNLSPHVLLGNSSAMLANRLSYYFNFSGPSLTIDTLCSSSLTALHLAIQSVRSGESSAAIAAGVRLGIQPEYLDAAKKMNALSPTGKCRSFSNKADGFVPGEGGVVIIIKPLTHAQKDNDNILAIIRGSAINHGGRGSGLTAPNTNAQKDVILGALKDANISADTISYVEAHGTGTELGDPIEFTGLSEAFLEHTTAKQFCGLGSVKTNIGHCEPAAGLAGLAKVVLSLQNKKLPATLHLETINPLISIEESPFYLVKETKLWDNSNLPLRAGISSFGIGGSNAHIILEEAPKTPKVSNEFDNLYNIFTFSAHNAITLRTLVNNHYNNLFYNKDINLKDLAFTLNVGRNHLEQRIAICANSLDNLNQSLNSYLLGKPNDILEAGSCKSHKKPKIIFLFTGQGSQYLHMAKELYENETIFASILNKCSQLLEVHLETSIIDIIFDLIPDASVKINQTRFAQPIIFSVEYALVQLLSSWGIHPDAVLGHSLGEYVAACVAGALSLEDSLKLISYRGNIMQALPSNNGAMLAISLPLEKIEILLQEFYEEIEISAINSQHEVTVSGSKDKINRLASMLLDKGIVFQELTVSHAFHSYLMEPILPTFYNFVQQFQFKPLQIPLISNLTGEVFNTGYLFNAEYWAQHLRKPVLFASNVTKIKDLGCSVGIEIGSHPVLTRYASENNNIEFSYTLKRNEANTLSVKKLLAKLYTRGVEINWNIVHSETLMGKRILLPSYPFRDNSYTLIDKQPSFPIDNFKSKTEPDEEKIHDVLLSNPEIELNKINGNVRIDFKILEIIKDLIAKNLKIPMDKIDSDKPLIELGADSLILLSVLAYINDKFKVKIKMIQLFEEIPTVNDIVNFINKNSKFK